MLAIRQERRSARAPARYFRREDRRRSPARGRDSLQRFAELIEYNFSARTPGRAGAALDLADHLRLTAGKDINLLKLARAGKADPAAVRRPKGQDPVLRSR